MAEQLELHQDSGGRTEHSCNWQEHMNECWVELMLGVR